MFVLMVVCWIMAVVSFFMGGFVFLNNPILSGFSFLLGNGAISCALMLAYKEGSGRS